jgi:hypothetical protein
MMPSLEVRPTFPRYSLRHAPTSEAFGPVNHKALNEPSEHHHSEGNDMETSNGPNNRKTLVPNVKNSTGTLTTRHVTDRISAVLLPFPAKVISRASTSSVRAAENVRQGMNGMSLAHFLNACRELPELRALAMELMGCDTTVDPEFQRGISLLMNSFARQQRGGE